MNAETHVLVAFLIFIYTTYSQAGGIIAKSLDDQREAIHAQLKKVDDAVMADLKETIKATEKVMELEGDIKSIFEITDEMAVAQADMLNVAEEHKYNKAIQKKLDALLVLEETATHACTIRMKNAVTADVKTVFSQDKAAKDKALAQAIAVLAAGPNGKLGKDVVGEFFGSAVKKYRDDYMKKPAGSDEILNNLERDMKEIAEAPHAGEGGGNVYITHPVMGHK
jgi:Mitochondrial ATP synthase B chain precursor (ATP-synt_B)